MEAFSYTQLYAPTDEPPPSPSKNIDIDVLIRRTPHDPFAARRIIVPGDKLIINGLKHGVYVDCVDQGGTVFPPPLPQMRYRDMPHLITLRLTTDGGGGGDAPTEKRPADEFSYTQLYEHSDGAPPPSSPFKTVVLIDVRVRRTLRDSVAPHRIAVPGDKLITEGLKRGTVVVQMDKLGVQFAVFKQMRYCDVPPGNTLWFTTEGAPVKNPVAILYHVDGKLWMGDGDPYACVTTVYPGARLLISNEYISWIAPGVTIGMLPTSHQYPIIILCDERAVQWAERKCNTPTGVDKATERRDNILKIVDAMENAVAESDQVAIPRELFEICRALVPVLIEAHPTCPAPRMFAGPVGVTVKWDNVMIIIHMDTRIALHTSDGVGLANTITDPAFIVALRRVCPVSV